MLDEEVVRLDYFESGVRYLTVIHDLYLNGFITPGIDRDLENKGKEFVSTAFPRGIDAKSIVTLVQAVQLKERPRIHFSELDAFVMDASSAIYVLTGSIIRTEITAAERTRRVSEMGTYILAGIHVLRKAVEQGLIEVNPQGCPTDKCYIRYLEN